MGSSLKVGLPGFEPGSLASEAKSLDQASRQPHANQESKPSKSLLIPNLIPKAISIDWKSYTQWYLQNHNKNTLGYALNYARKYADVLADPLSMHRRTSLSKAKKRMTMIALANLSKYLGIYEHWRSIVKNAGLKWEKKNALDTLINILNTDITKVEEWLKSIIPKLSTKYSMQLMYNTLTGLRPTEGCMSCTLLVELSEKEDLDKYLDRDLMMLQHFRFPKLFLRGSKNAYISFIPESLLQLVLEHKPTVKYQALKSAVRKKKQGIQMTDKIKAIEKGKALTFVLIENLIHIDSHSPYRLNVESACIDLTN